MRSGDLKVGDFGLSRRLGSTDASRPEQGAPDSPNRAEEESRRSVEIEPDDEMFANTACGTPYYMSPEQVMGRPYGYPVDLWALGCVVFELIALRRAFAAEGFAELAGVIAASAYEEEPLREAPHFASIKRLASRAALLHPDPARRTTLAQLLQQLGEIVVQFATPLTGEQSASTPPPPYSQPTDVADLAGVCEASWQADAAAAAVAAAAAATATAPGADPTANGSGNAMGNSTMAVHPSAGGTAADEADEGTTIEGAAGCVLIASEGIANEHTPQDALSPSIGKGALSMSVAELGAARCAAATPLHLSPPLLPSPHLHPSYYPLTPLSPSPPASRLRACALRAPGADAALSDLASPSFA